MSDSSKSETSYYAEERKAEREAPYDRRQAIALEHIADDLSALLHILREAVTEERELGTKPTTTTPNRRQRI